jgi:hypothetical protein
MPGSVNSYRIHARKTMGGLQQFCHAQHVDQGQGKNVKDNRYRIAFRDKVNTIRNRERQSWYNGPTAIYEYSALNPSQGSPVQLHPSSVLGKQWHPNELFQFATRNFQCEYFFWHYRENVHNMNTQFWWEDIRPIIQNNQYFYN